jgi:Hypothetical protein FLILHELTA
MFSVRLSKYYQKAALRPSTHRLFSACPRRALPSTPPPPSPLPQSDRIARILGRTPRFLRPTVSALHNAPITHITAFLILHEITAIVPLLGLVGAFHYFHWLPPYFAEGKWVVAGAEKFGNYFRKKGWIDSRENEKARELAGAGDAREVEKKEVGITKSRIAKWWGRGETGTRLVIEFATAYAVVKVLLPLRLFLSVWGAPWFAKWTIVPFSNMAKGMLKTRSRQVGTGATAAGGSTGVTKGISGEKVIK